MKYADLGEGSIYQAKNGRWYCAFTLGYDGAGRQVRRTTSASSYEKLLPKRAALIAELLSLRRTPEEITIETWAEEWLENIAFHRLHPLVLADHRSKVRKYVVPTLGKYRLADVGAEEVREVHAAVRRARVSERTVQIVHTVLSTCLRDAVREGLIDSNPVDRVERPKAKGRVRPALSTAEARRVLMTAAREEDPLASFWAAALMLGARRGELIGMEWSRLGLGAGHVDLSWQVQTLPWQHGERCKCRGEVPAARCGTRRHAVAPGFEWRECHESRVWTRPKTAASVRLLPLPEPLRLTLLKHREMVGDNDFDLVWVTGNGLPLGLKELTNRWRGALKAASVPVVDFHSARHTTASLLLEAGVTPEVIAQMLGHSTIAATRGYMHVTRSMADDAMQAMGELLS